jgi:LuxR family transcriptional regulator, maltose regulon positive regulatory protein
VKPESVARRPGPTVDGPVSLVLRAKLHEPRFRPEWVRRSRLLRDLRFARDAGVVLVEAPAGYGKSTLIAQWKAADPAPFAWVGLDASDNDPVRFWTYTLQAIAGVLPELGGEVSTPIRTTRRLRNLGLPRLLNDLAEIDGRRLGQSPPSVSGNSGSSARSSRCERTTFASMSMKPMC